MMVQHINRNTIDVQYFQLEAAMFEADLGSNSVAQNSRN